MASVMYQANKRQMSHFQVVLVLYQKSAPGSDALLLVFLLAFLPLEPF